MNLLKNGFSLAEMLITLAIIGVVATITMPALQVNTQKAQVIPALKKAVNTLEAAHQQIIQEHEVRTLASVAGNANLYRNRLKEVMIGVNSVAKSYKVKVNNKDKTLSAITSVQGKDSITFFSSQQDTVTFNSGEDTEIKFKCEYVYVDINGAKGPNRVGADVFLLLVDLRNGNVIPYGSRSFKIGDKSWQTECAADNTVPVDAEFCAASIVENGWQILYKY